MSPLDPRRMTRSPRFVCFVTCTIVWSGGCNEYVAASTGGMDAAVAGNGGNGGGGDGGYGGFAGVTGPGGQAAVGGCGGTLSVGGGGTSSLCPTMCPPLPGGPLQAFASCCSETVTCGVTLRAASNFHACLEREQVGADDGQCASETLELRTGAGFGVPVVFPGCCRSDDRCGLRVRILDADSGAGCVERRELEAASAPTMSISPGDWTSASCTFGAGQDDVDGAVRVEGFTSCKEILDANPASVSAVYEIAVPGFATRNVYCDMTTAGGGWTAVSFPETTEDEARALLGQRGRQLLKCSEGGSEHIVSPPVTGWSWTPGVFVQAPGTWTVNGSDVACGNDPEFSAVSCTTWFGVGCGDGPGPFNKLFPGVSDAFNGACANRRTAHTNAAFSICGDGAAPDNYDSWVVFLREE